MTVFAPIEVTLPGVPLPTSVLRTCAGLAVGVSPRISAMAPATCGLAIEVPESTAVPLLLVELAEVMLPPGAKMSMQAPKLENEDMPSPRSVEPTVIAFGAL